MARPAVTVPEHRVRGWLTAFETDAPLASHFPRTLSNGDIVPGLHVVCTCCGQRITPDAVRGQVLQSLPHVLTVEGNGLCEVCDRLTHIDCRFRSNHNGTVIEWCDESGRWLRKPCQRPTLRSRIERVCRKIAGALASV